jgi:hypothetical protein
MSAVQVFRFRFDPRFRLPLAALGVLPGTASVVVADGRLTARFGPWNVSTSLGNVVDAKVTGPYKPYRAIGVRLSGQDSGLTFGTTAARGVCIAFAEPVRGFDPVGVLRHDGLTVTVDDCEGLVEALLGR